MLTGAVRGVSWLGSRVLGLMQRLASAEVSKSRFTKFSQRVLGSMVDVPSNVRSIPGLIRYIKTQPLSAGKALTRNLLVAAGASLAVDETSELIDAMYMDESEANAGDVAIVAEIVEGITDLNSDAGQSTIKNVYPDIAKSVDDEKLWESNVSPADIAKFYQNKKAADKMIASVRASALSQSLAAVEPARENLRKASAMLGLSQARTIELAELLREIDSSYKVLL